MDGFGCLVVCFMVYTPRAFWFHVCKLVVDVNGRVGVGLGCGRPGGMCMPGKEGSGCMVGAREPIQDWIYLK